VNDVPAGWSGEEQINSPTWKAFSSPAAADHAEPISRRPWTLGTHDTKTSECLRLYTDCAKEGRHRRLSTLVWLCCFLWHQLLQLLFVQTQALLLLSVMSAAVPWANQPFITDSVLVTDYMSSLSRSQLGPLRHRRMTLMDSTSPYISAPEVVDYGFAL